MDELEVLLRQFQPRHPGRLPEVEHPRGSRPLVWIALSGLAAGVVLMVGWREQRLVLDVPNPTRMTVGDLNAYIVRDISDLDGFLTRTSPMILPRVDRPGGVLSALAKE